MMSAGVEGIRRLQREASMRRRMYEFRHSDLARQAQVRAHGEAILAIERRIKDSLAASIHSDYQIDPQTLN